MFYKFSKAFCFGQFSRGLAYDFLSLLVSLPGDHLRFHHFVGCLCAASFSVVEHEELNCKMPFEIALSEAYFHSCLSFCLALIVDS